MYLFHIPIIWQQTSFKLAFILSHFLSQISSYNFSYSTPCFQFQSMPTNCFYWAWWRGWRHNFSFHQCSVCVPPSSKSYVEFDENDTHVSVYSAFGSFQCAVLRIFGCIRLPSRIDFRVRLLHTLPNQTQYTVRFSYCNSSEEGNLYKGRFEQAWSKSLHLECRMRVIKVDGIRDSRVK